MDDAATIRSRELMADLMKIAGPALPQDACTALTLTIAGVANLHGLLRTKRDADLIVEALNTTLRNALYEVVESKQGKTN